MATKVPGGAPYTVRLDAESARELAQRGGTILLLGVPEGAAVGMDQQVGQRWRTSSLSAEMAVGPMSSAAVAGWLREAG